MNGLIVLFKRLFSNRISSILIRLVAIGHQLIVYIFVTCCRVKKRRRMFLAIYFGVGKECFYFLLNNH